MDTAPARPWYRSPWPWLLVVPPAAAVIGGAITLYLAVTRPDVLVRDDCHREGAITVCGEATSRAP